MNTYEAPTTEKLEGMLRKVQALLTRADHPNTPVPEAESCRNKAEALMFRYRIDEAMFAQAQPAGLEIKPQWTTFDVCDINSEFHMHYRMIAREVLDHVGIRGVFKQAQRPVLNEDGVAETMAYRFICEAVGYESDLRIAEALYVSCMLAFQARLEPKVDRTLSDQENAYNLRSAGMEGWRIAQAIFGRDDKSLRPKVRAMFKAEAIKRGEDPTVLLGKGNSVKAFREDFATGFAYEMRSRLMSMRAARAEADQGAVVLASRNEAINEAFYAVYPQYRPVDAPIRSTTGYVDPRKGCAKCAKAKSGYCRDHGYLKPRYSRAGRDTNWQAYDRGRDAAKAVDLGADPRKPKVTGNEHKEIN